MFGISFHVRRYGTFSVLGVLALTAPTLLALAPARADAALPAGLPATVSADGLPTAQINGVVWAQVTVGTTVYATGKFTTARPAGVASGGAGTVTRNNILAYNITTGVLSTSFVHSLNAQGRAIAASPDGTRVYVVGDFTSVDGVTHNRIAAFSTATGALVATFTASLNAYTSSVAASNSAVYAGGSFTSANNNTRTRLAAYTSAGALTAWNPGADSIVRSLTVTPDGSRVIAGGGFTNLANVAASGMGSVDATTGASEPWAANQVIQDGSSDGGINSLTTDGNLIYGTGFYGFHGNFEGRFAADPSTGRIVWLNNCHGDSYSVYSTGSVVYSAGHEHDCSDVSSFSQDSLNIFASTHHFGYAETTTASGVNRHPLFPGGQPDQPGPMYSNMAGQPSSTQLDWYPTFTEGTFTGQSQAAWSVSGNGQYVSFGGEFPTVNGVVQQGLVRFAMPSIAPNKIGPTAAASLTPKVYSQTASTARIAWQATSDQDNTALTYALSRDNTVIYRTTVNSTFWNRPNIGYLDTGLSAGGSHSYQVVVTDPFGNSQSSATSSVTVGSATPGSYTSLVLGDGAANFWPLSDASGSTAADRAGYSDLTLSGSISLGRPGPGADNAATAASFSGGETTPSGPGQFGGPPAPVPNDTAGTTGNVSPTGAFSVEAWVRTTSTQGGAIVGEGLYRSATSAAIDKTIYLDNAGRVFLGIQDNAVKQTINSSGSYNDGGWHLVAATYSNSSARLYVDGTQVAASSTMADDIAFPGYWRVGGDNLTGWASAPSTNYLAATIADVATYPSELSAATLASHTAAGTGGGGGGGNQSPTAAFTTACTQLTCNFASTSTDSDGTISSTAWTFGDTTSGSGSPVGHTYGSADTYSVNLTVTDNDGATDTSTQSVTVVSGSAPLAQDQFNRTVSGGWGTAPTGGVWTATTNPSSLSVTPGAGVETLAAGKGTGAYLGSVSASGVDIVTSVTLPTLPAGGNGYYFYVVGRRVNSTEQYLARVRVRSASSPVEVALSKFDGSATESMLTSEVSVGTITAGTTLNIRVDVTGASPTTLQTRVWKSGTTEPSAWTVSTTDSSAGLQTGGAIGVQGYLSGTVTNAPISANVGPLTASAG